MTDRDASAGAGEGGAEVIELPPLVRLARPSRWRSWSTDSGGQAWLPACRSRRVSVSWSKGPGMRHLTWEPADHIRRV